MRNDTSCKRYFASARAILDESVSLYWVARALFYDSSCMSTRRELSRGRIERYAMKSSRGGLNRTGKLFELLRQNK